MDEINLIEKTRQQLIAQHGENKVEIVNGMTLHKINEYLTNFDLFEQNFESYLAFLNIPMPSQTTLAPLYKYFEMAEVNDIKDVAMALAKKQRLFKERQRNKLTNEIDTLINDLNELSKNPSANFYTVKFILENDLKIYYVSNYPKDKRVIRHGRRKFFYNA